MLSRVDSKLKKGNKAKGLTGGSVVTVLDATTTW